MPTRRPQSPGARLVVLLLSALAFVPGNVAAQEQPTTRITFDGIGIDLTGRVHTQFSTTSVDGENPAEFLLRRVRFGLDFQVNDVISGRIHPDFGRNRIGLGDAYMQIETSPAFAIQAGRSHRPFGRIEQLTSLRIAPIERGVSIRGVDAYELSDLLNTLGYSDRDVGLRVVGEIPGAPAGLSYLAGVYNGPVQQILGGETSLQYVARVEGEIADLIGVGLGWNRRDFSSLDAGVVDKEGRNAWVADFEYGASVPTPGLHIIGEASTGAVDAISDSDFTGAQAWISYIIGGEGAVSGIEPLFRVSHVSIDDQATLRGGTLFTPGFNVYLGGLNRVQLNYDIFSPETGDTETSFKAQFQIVF